MINPPLPAILREYPLHDTQVDFPLLEEKEGSRGDQRP